MLFLCSLSCFSVLFLLIFFLKYLCGFIFDHARPSLPLRFLPCSVPLSSVSVFFPFPLFPPFASSPQPLSSRFNSSNLNPITL